MIRLALVRPDITTLPTHIQRDVDHIVAAFAGFGYAISSQDAYDAWSWYCDAAYCDEWIDAYAVPAGDVFDHLRGYFKEESR